MAGSVAITIGNFDGVHVGHAALIQRARSHAGTSGRVIALAFDPHPLTKVAPAAAPARLTSFEFRASLLRELGADEVVRLQPSDEFLSTSPSEFIERVVSTYRPGAIVEGADFHFGKGRAGNVATLRELGGRMGFAVDVVDAVGVAISDHCVVRASSTMVRWLIERGRVGDAAALLGRCYEIRGTVERGDQRGRTIGFPTANLHQDGEPLLLPADGVYACVARMPDGRELPAAVNIGTRPTFQGQDRRVEAHLIDASTRLPASGVGEYGWPISLAFVAFVRDQVRFSGIDALRMQLERDRRRVVDLIESDAPAAMAPVDAGECAR
ncbi:MAG: riboflavin biosynthesis protein RibF [Phycisphaerales bacterium]|nr:riboflavin biosynthesis protein RibF [Phycisphaerales bacterium]